MQRTITAAAAVIGTLALAAPTAYAHDSVISGTPDNESTVQVFPNTISLEFSGQPQEGFNTVALSRASDGEVLFTGEPEIDGRVVTIDVPDEVESNAEPGEYTVGYQIISSDGHSTKGMSSFTFEPGASDAADNADNTEAADEEGGNSGLLTILGILVGVLVCAGAAVAALAKSRKFRALNGEDAASTSEKR